MPASFQLNQVPATLSSVFSPETGKLQPLGSNEQPGDVIQNFGAMLNEQLNNVSNAENVADQQVQAYATGADIPVHQVMISMEKAGGAMDLAVQVRNKLVGAYQEISRMQF